MTQVILTPLVMVIEVVVRFFTMTTPGYCSQSTIVIMGYLIGTARHSHGCTRELACSAAVT